MHCAAHSCTSFAHAPAGGWLGQGFHLLGAYWTGSMEAVDVIDGDTGEATYVGNLADLYLLQLSTLQTTVVPLSREYILARR